MPGLWRRMRESILDPEALDRLGIKPALANHPVYHQGDPLMSVEDAAARLNLDTARVQEFLDSGELQGWQAPSADGQVYTSSVTQYRSAIGGERSD